MWFRRKQKPIIYQLAGLLAVLAVVGILISGTNLLQKQRELRAERKAAAARVEAQRQQTLLQAERVTLYQKYCEPAVLRIDSGGDILRIIKNTTKDAILYERGGKQFTCPNASNPDCKLVDQTAFEGVYNCPLDPMSAARSGANALVMNTQPAGTAVVIDRVVMAAPGFVRIESNATPPTAISNSALLPAGVLEYVSIAIPTPLIGGLTYRATLYQDNGDGQFSDADTAVTNDAGQPLMTTFQVKRR